MYYTSVWSLKLKKLKNKKLNNYFIIFKTEKIVSLSQNRPSSVNLQKKVIHVIDYGRTIHAHQYILKYKHHELLL